MDKKLRDQEPFASIVREVVFNALHEDVQEVYGRKYDPDTQREVAANEINVDN